MSISLLGAMMLGLIVAGAILLIVSLVASERGRTLLKALLIVPAVFLVIALLAVLGYRATAEARHKAMAKHRAHLQRMEAEEARVRSRQRPSGRLSGTITCNERLLPCGTIRLAGGNDGPMPIVQAEVVKGRYSFSGLPSGSYRVEVTAFRTAGGTGSEEGEVETLEAEQYLPKRYNEESYLRVDVDRGKNEIDFDLNVDLDKALSDGRVPIAMAAAHDSGIEFSEPEDPDTTEGAVPPDAADSASEIAAADEEIAAALAADVAPAEKTPPADEDAAVPLFDPDPGSDALPDWAEAPPQKVQGVYRVAIWVGPYVSREECDQALPEEIRKAVDDYVATYLGPQAREEIHLPLDYITSEIVAETFEERRAFEITPDRLKEMTRLHVLLEFDRAVNARIQEEWNTVMVRDRLLGVGALGALVLVLLGAVWSYLRIDLATGGAYRRRLRLCAAVLVAIAIVVGWVLLRVGGLSAGV
jgi:hypothetical protein